MAAYEPTLTKRIAPDFFLEIQTRIHKKTLLPIFSFFKLTLRLGWICASLYADIFGSVGCIKPLIYLNVLFANPPWLAFVLQLSV